jgi:hypothetical protein
MPLRPGKKTRGPRTLSPSINGQKSLSRDQNDYTLGDICYTHTLWDGKVNASEQAIWTETAIADDFALMYLSFEGAWRKQAQ